MNVRKNKLLNNIVEHVKPFDNVNLRNVSII